MQKCVRLSQPAVWRRRGRLFAVSPPAGGLRIRRRLLFSPPRVHANFLSHSVAFSRLLPAFDAAISAASSSRPTHRCLGRLVDWEIIISSATGADCHLRRDQNTRLELRQHAALSPAAAIRLFPLQRTAPLKLNPLSTASADIFVCSPDGLFNGCFVYLWR